METLKEVVMVTGNQGKFEIAQGILKKYNIKVVQKKLDLPEIQSQKGEEVSEYSARLAYEKIKKPLIKSDVSYEIEALNGFPGPYVKDMNYFLKPEDILAMLKGKKNRNIKMCEYLTYFDGNNIKQFKYENICTLSEIAMGEGTTFDQIIIFNGYNKPKATLSYEENIEYFKNNLYLYNQFGEFLSSNK